MIGCLHTYLVTDWLFDMKLEMMSLPTMHLVLENSCYLITDWLLVVFLDH